MTQYLITMCIYCSENHMYYHLSITIITITVTIYINITITSIFPSIFYNSLAVTLLPLITGSLNKPTLSVSLDANWNNVQCTDSPESGRCSSFPLVKNKHICFFDSATKIFVNFDCETIPLPDNASPQRGCFSIS